MDYLSKSNLIKLGFSQTEIKVINILLKNKGVVLKPSELEIGSNSNNVKVTISRIRKKIKQSGLKFGIKTVWGGGYVYFGEGL